MVLSWPFESLIGFSYLLPITLCYYIVGFLSLSSSFSYEYRRYIWFLGDLNVSLSISSLLLRLMYSSVMAS